MIQLTEILSYVQEAIKINTLSAKEIKESQQFWKEELIIYQHKERMLEKKIEQMSKKYEAAISTFHLSNYLEATQDYRKELGSILRSKDLRDSNQNNVLIIQKYKLQLETLNHYEQQIQKKIKD